MSASLISPVTDERVTTYKGKKIRSEELCHSVYHLAATPKPHSTKTVPAKQAGLFQCLCIAHLF